MSTHSSGKAGGSLIEVRSIDFIPDAERHGGLLSQFTLWLSANMQITAIVTGALAVVLGGDVFWSLVALLLGQLIGGAVMALHGAQGPQLGLPQMISSRVQFGVYGAMIPIVLVCLMYVGFSASGSVLAGQAVAQLLHVDDATGILLFAAVIVCLTVCGYRAIHFVGRIASVIGIIAFVYMFAQLFANHDIGALLANRHFSLASFLLSMSLSASWQIAFGPYVADYSRYLPRSTSSVRTFLAVGLGSVLGAQAAMVFGVFAAALAGSRFAHHEVAYIVGLGSTGAVAALLYLSIAFGKVTVTTLNAYGSFMSMATIVSGFRGKGAVSSKSRLAYIFGMICVSTLLALAGRHSFLKEFTAFILFLLAFFTPWSAINLVDYYCFTKSRYDVPALSDPDGRYGRWNVMAVTIYVVGVLVQLPFMSTHIYTGPLVDALGGTDISWILGLLVPAVLYYIGARASRRQIPERLILPLERGEIQH
ncbi:sulfonate ABC transporter substrate-binding protein [Burkholderia ubonensis]|uniref:purine-cytosine permease family protein n=1 Tax=Burkholderia ubonensis TaxID=101571 RepID=UPI0007527E85|nr:cytosine permease [Burkholderia ubonensis]KVO12197.1 sulfonate ABC transporter substrate-binding protein [Burkholderia ubonensis]